MLRVVPELEGVVELETEVVMNKYSEHIGPSDWAVLAEEVYTRLRNGNDGIVVLHGTDTMGYTAAALSFALQGLPAPVVLVGSQRSSDRPSSDAATNLVGAVRTASDLDVAEVLVAMHESLSDDVIALHRGTRVRKNHTSRRDAFQSIDQEPVALQRLDGSHEVVEEPLVSRDTSRELELRAEFEPKVALLKFHPGFDGGLIEFLVDEGYRGIVLEGSGLGHFNQASFPSVRLALESGLFVGMASQCIWGRVDMKVYDTGRDLTQMGVVPLGDMLPETALVKAMWALGQEEAREEVESIMKEPLAGEVLPRSRWLPRGFPS